MDEMEVAVQISVSSINQTENIRVYSVLALLFIVDD
jgi:hypothetical protein